MADGKRRRRGDRIPGGRADARYPWEFDPRELAMGAGEEAGEHSKGDLDTGAEIAMDHLADDPRYYSKERRDEDAPQMRDVFSARDRAEIEADKPEDVESDEAVHELSPAFGAIERGLNEAKRKVESIDGIDRERVYEYLDQVADHAYEVWRHVVYGEPMVRWVRRS